MNVKPHIPADQVLEQALVLVKSGVKNPLVALQRVAETMDSDGMEQVLAFSALRYQAGMSLVEWYGPNFTGADRTHEEVVALFEEAIFHLQLGAS